MEKELKKYNEKRNFSKTKEPLGKKGKSSKKLRFVVQHHLARKDHYDFRLEWKGTLLSWAVPKGPSYNPKDKRLAVHVENHPISYRNFEGVIPKGEYGGGTVMVWDEGYWFPLYDVDKSLQKGSLKFEIKSHRLNGKWALVRFKDNNWLLLKEIDSSLGFVDIKEYDRSIKTGRTMEEIEQNANARDNIVSSIEITSPNKIIFNKPKITKLDIAKYYEKVANRMLPLINNRIISVIRAPEGMEKDIFFKKHLETKHLGIGKIKISNDKDKKDDYYYVKDTVGLISEVQMNSFEFHLWGSSITNINRPNMMVFDLDPDESLSLSKVRDGVRDLKSILNEFNLISFLKTSGGKGYHVVVPFTSIKSWKHFREIAKNIAMLMEARWPDKYVSNIRKDKRNGKIFIDWIRNTKGATSVAPYSLRLRKNGTVSMPIFWNELDKIKPDEVTIEKAIKRLKRKDPWENILSIQQ